MAELTIPPLKTGMSAGPPDSIPVRRPTFPTQLAKGMTGILPWLRISFRARSSTENAFRHYAEGSFPIVVSSSMAFDSYANSIPRRICLKPA